MQVEDFVQVGIEGGGEGAGGSGLAGSDFAGLVEFEVRRARALFADGYRLLPMLDRRSGACVAAMAGTYRRLLDRIAAQPAAVLRGRTSLSGREKAVVAVKALSGRLG